MKIQLKRSNVQSAGVAKAPTAAQMEYGELAVNYNTADPVIFIKDSAGAIIRLTNDNSSIDQDISDINNQIIVIEGDISSIKGDITTIQGDVSTIQGEITTINNSISEIETDIAVLPDPLEGTTHQPGTLDMRYVSRFSWSDLPVLA